MSATTRRRKTGSRKGSARKRAGRGLDLKRVREIGGLAAAAAGCFLALVLYLGWSGGLAGGWSEELLRYLFGVLIYLSPPALIGGGALLIFPDAPLGPHGLRAGLLLLLIALFLITGANTFSVLGSAPAHTSYFDTSYFSGHGGITGDALYWVTGSLIGDVGSSIAAVFLLMAAAFLITGASVRTAIMASGVSARRAAAGASKSTRQLSRSLSEKMGKNTIQLDGESTSASASTRPAVGESPAACAGGSGLLNGAAAFPDIYGPGGPAPAAAPAPEAVLLNNSSNPTSQLSLLEETGDDDDYRHDEESGYVLPDSDLLRKSGAGQTVSADSADRISRVLVETLASFGIEAIVAGSVSGPRVTRYELQLAPGIKVSRVSSLKNDIAYALATTDIRILAPIPGKSAVGVEVPNVSPNLVTLGDIFRDFPDKSGPLMAWLGKDISGKPVYADLAQMPHLLVAGTTGSGKSGCINCMISSILLRSTPEEVKMILIDPKRVELSHFEGIPHLLTPVVTVMKDAANVLANLVQEMDSRYSQMQLARARHLDELNRVRAARSQQPVPYILLVVDELADLMMVSPAEVEDAIIRLAQKARAVGIHLVLATQRPSVDVITGMIKANVPSRIAFAVSSQVDSRVILDTTGAESLLGQGDMLFRPLGASQLKRIQGAYVSEEEIKLLTDRCRGQRSPDFRHELLEGKIADGDEGFPADEDDLLPEAMQLVVSTGTASVSFLQRRLRVGYTRAGRLIDMLEKRGVISGYEGSKPRRVLVGEESLEHILAGSRAGVGAGGSVEGGPNDAGSDGFGADD